MKQSRDASAFVSIFIDLYRSVDDLTEYNVIRDTAITMANMLLRDNNMFNRESFLISCGVL